MITYFEIWGIGPKEETRFKIIEYEEKYWQRAIKKAFFLENNGYTKIVIYEKIKQDRTKEV